MEDQQPVAGDLTEGRDDEARADSAVETEAVETSPAMPGKTDSGYQPKRRHSFGRRRVSTDRTAASLPDSAAREDAGEVTTETAQDRGDEAAGPPVDGDTAHLPVETGDEAAREPADAAEEPAIEPVGDTEPAGTDEAEPNAQAMRVRKQAGKWSAAAVLTAATLFVGSAAFAGAAVQTYVADRVAVVTKQNVARTAANAITTLWSYTPENLDKLGDRAATYLSGDFEAQYRKFVDALVAPNKQAQISNSTVVTGAAVESLEGPNAVAMVYTNTTSTSPVTKNIPALRYLSYRLFMKRDHARWLVTRMTTITSLDLTPQL